MPNPETEPEHRTWSTSRWSRMTGEGALGRPLRWSILGGLVLLVSISPEIPLDLGIAVGRQFTVRLEDLLLTAVLLCWAVTAYRFRDLYLPAVAVPLFGYLLVALSTTLGGVLLYDLPVARGAFYLLKEVEFALFALLVANLVESREDLAFFLGCFLLGGALNATWMGYQVATGDFGPLFATVDVAKWRYGPSLLGQPSVLASAGFFLTPTFLAYGYLRYHPERRVRALCAGLLLCFLACISLTVSRATIGATVITLVALIFASSGRAARTSQWLLGAGASGLALAGVIAALNPLFVRRFLPFALIGGIESRLEIWQSFVGRPLRELLVGYGKGGTAVVVGIEEAHNFYLRLLTETGVLGLSLFLVTLSVAIRTSIVLVRRSDDPLFQSIGAACVGVTLSLLIIALFQDVFINVKVAEVYWLLVGATAGAWKLFDASRPA